MALHHQFETAIKFANLLYCIQIQNEIISFCFNERAFWRQITSRWPRLLVKKTWTNQSSEIIDQNLQIYLYGRVETIIQNPC